jgi:hypothetical protein
MELENYFKQHNIKPTPWAIEHGISPAVVNRYLKNKGVLNTINALKIERACNEEVTVADLLARYKYTLAKAS